MLLVNSDMLLDQSIVYSISVVSGQADFMSIVFITDIRFIFRVRELSSVTISKYLIYRVVVVIAKLTIYNHWRYRFLGAHLQSISRHGFKFFQAF